MSFIILTQFIYVMALLQEKLDPNVYNVTAAGPSWWCDSFLRLLLTIHVNLDPGKNSHKYLGMSLVVRHEHIVNKRGFFAGKILPPKYWGGLYNLGTGKIWPSQSLLWSLVVTKILFPLSSQQLIIKKCNVWDENIQCFDICLNSNPVLLLKDLYIF